MWFYVLFTLYAIELVTLFAGMVYVSELWLKRTAYINPHLSGRSLKWAALTPFRWVLYISSDAHAVWDVCRGINTDLPHMQSALKQKAVREALSLVIGVITILVLSGYKFGEE